MSKDWVNFEGINAIPTAVGERGEGFDALPRPDLAPSGREKTEDR